MVVITMQSGLLSPLDDNFIAAADQYCTGECSSHMLFVSKASELARVLLHKIYFLLSPNNYIKQLQKCVGNTGLAKRSQKRQLLLLLGNYNKSCYSSAGTSSQNSLLECLPVTVTVDWQA